MSLPKIVKLWNFYFLKGKAFLIQFGLAIFSIYQSSILSMDQDEVPIFLKNQLRDLSDDDDSIFEKALEFKVTMNMLEDLEPFYQQGKPKLVMRRDYRNKVRWQLSNPIPSKSVPCLDGNGSKSRINTNSIRLNQNSGFESRTVILGKGDETPSRMRALLDSVKQLDISDSIKNIFRRPENQNQMNLSRTEFSSNTSSNNSPKRIKDSRMINATQDHSNTSHSHNLTSSPTSPHKDRSPFADYHRNVLNIDESEENSPHFETQRDESSTEPTAITKHFEAMRKQQSAAKLKARGGVSDYQYSAGNSSIGDLSPSEKGSTLRRSPLTASTGKLPNFGFTSHAAVPSQRLDERYMSIISLSKIEPSFGGQKVQLVDGERTLEMDMKNKAQRNQQLLGSGSNSPDYRPKVYSKGAPSIIN